MMPISRTERAAAEMMGVLMLIALFVAVVAVIAVVLFSQPPPMKIPAVSISITNQSKLISVSHSGGDTINLSSLSFIVDGQSLPSSGWSCTGCGTDWSVGDTVLIDRSSQVNYPNEVKVIYTNGSMAPYVLQTMFLANVYPGTAQPTTGVPQVVAPVAGFTNASPPHYAGVPFTFMDTSANTPTSWLWNFGDGTTSTLRNPAHAYPTPGTYTVSLTATNSAGSNTLTRSNYITVRPTPTAPVANFTADQFWGLVPLSVTFTDRSTNSPSSWIWDFGDGSTSTLQNPQHVYASMGYYNVSLTATNPGGSNTTTRVGYITAGKYVQGWKARYYGVELNWEPANLAFTNNPPRINFQNDYCLANYPTTITEGTDVANWPYPYLGSVENYSVEYDALLRVDTTGSYTFYLESDDGSWMWLDGTQVIDNSGLHQPEYRTYTTTLTAGTYHPIKVRMHNHYGGADIALKYTGPGIPLQFVTNVYRITAVDPPTAFFEGSPLSGQRPLTVQFTDQSTFPTGWMPTPNNWSWSFGDGNITGQTLQNPSHTYTAQGTYTVALTASNDGGSNTYTRNNYITVTPPPRETIFYDGFETNTLSTYSRTSTTRITWSTDTPRYGTHLVRIANSASLAKTIDTSGYSDIMVNFSWNYDGFESSDYGYFDYSTTGGTPYTRIFTQYGPGSRQPTLTNVSISLPAAAADNPDFRIRFGDSGNSGTDVFYFDEVRVSGIPM